jgi:aryl-alcohol dehydrogenase-like predicted oxidoreductase
VRYRSLGRSGVPVSEVGFGAWGIGGNKDGAVAYGPTDEAQSLDALSAAFDAGITFYDTADLYGYGESERLIGRAFASRRDKVVIASKVGMLDAAGKQDFSPARIESALDASLQRLRTDYVDLYQLHSPPLDALRPELLAVLDELKKKGKVRAVGISLKAPEEGEKALALYPFAAMQVNFNLLDQRLLDLGLAQRCLEKGAGIIARTPLCFGFLTTKYSADEAFDPSDHRSRWSVEQRRVWASANELFQNYRRDAETAAQFAIRFCLSFDAVSSVIPGMLTRDHVEENSGSVAAPVLAAAEKGRIRDVYRSNRFFIGR